MLTQTATRLLLLFALCAGPPALHAANVLLITQTSGSLIASESARKNQFEAWGHVVTTLGDNSSQASYDAAMASVDVVYIPMTVQEWEIATKVKGTTKGVVCEERYLDIEMGFSSADGWNANHNQTEVLSNSHAVTTGLSTGYVTVTSSSQELAMMNPTLAGGMTVLSKQNYSAGSMLGVMEQGAALAGGGTAAGRRVRLPWGGDNFNWSSLNADGLKIAQQAIAWAVGNSSPLLVHWKFNETNGATAVDASQFGRNGAITGTTAWTFGRRNGALQLGAGGKCAVASLLNQPTSFTIAAWVKADSVGSTGGVAVSVGDHIALVMDDPTSGGQPAIAFTHSGTSFRIASGGGSAVGAGWRHYVGVFDDAANSLKLFVDGVLVSNVSTTNSVSWSTTIGTSTSIGTTSYPTATYHLTGAIDDVRVYNRALTASEISEVHGLIAHWKLDETTGSTANDSSLAANHATRTGTQAWTSGHDNGGHGFLYTNGEDYFTAPTNTALDNVQEDDVTVMAYFKPNSLPPGSGSNNLAAYGIVRKQGYHAGLVYDNQGQIMFEHWLTGPTWSGAGTWGQSYAPGKFYHVAGVVSRSSGTVKIYVDGKLINTGAFTPGSAAWEFDSNRWRIGVSNPGGGDWGQPCDGVIDDVRIYNRALSDEEISEYAAQGLLAHWRFDESAGTVAVDSSGNDNDAEFASGTPSWSTAVRANGLTLTGASTAATTAPFSPPQSGSIAFWFRHYGLTAATQRLFGSSDTWEVRLSPGGLLTFDLAPGDGPTATEAFLASGRWRHVVIRYQADGDYSMFLDGQPHVSGTSPSPTAAGATLSFGTRTGSANHFAGSLDDVRVYSYELSEEEIADIYGLVGRWKLDESTGAVANDTSGAGRHGTILGTPQLGQPGPKAGLAAMSFDGADDSVLLPAIDDSFAEGVSIALWAKPTASGSDSKFMLLSAGTNKAIALGRHENSSSLRSNANPNQQLLSASQIANNAWRHYAMTIDHTGWAKHYCDGALVGEAQRQVPEAGSRTTNAIGDSQWSADALYTGQMHDVRLYNRAMTPSEVRTLFYGQFVPGARIVRWEEVR